MAVSTSGIGAERGPVDEIAFFEQHIRPLLISRCYSCHSVKSGNREGDLVLDSRQGWESGGENGPAIRPFDTDGSLVIRAVRHTDPDLQMPPDHMLSAAEIGRLEQWVAMGARDPRDAADASAYSHDDPSDPVAGRQHWAFRPLKETPSPSSASAGWATSTIDSLVAAKRQARSLSPVQDADRSVLARRLYLKLVGLPPTSRQIESFIRDQRPDAVERLVDQLLDSHHFGERWGRHWLDLARYADSNGLDENFLFREAWRYRNRVIDSFNADVPFDRFLVEQIAGDLLPFESIEQRDRQRISAGFLVIGPKVLLGNDARERRMDVADEQIDTIGRAVLGQTLGCARCHDHKFDPIPTADYYALAGIMTSTQVMETRYMLGQQRLMEQLVGIGIDGNQADEDYETYWRERPKLQKRVAQAKAALGLLEKSDFDALAKHATEHTDSLADGVMDESIKLSQRVTNQKTLIGDLEKRIASPPPIPPRAMIPHDLAEPINEHIRLAGQFDRLGDEVPRGFLRVLAQGDTSVSDSASGRLELARWLTDTEQGAGHLSARVLANRIWHHLIGRGIVRTVDNFGRTGEAPSHPELLDYLAVRLIESGWSVKSLIREVVLSRTFAMSSRHDASQHAIDPENTWLWRANRGRLDPESFRDSMLSAAGMLDRTPMDSSVWYLGDQATAVGANKNRRRTDFLCRSVYLPVIRNDLPELFDAFDFADPHAATGMRPDTMVPTQGLFVLNDDSVWAAAEATAERVLETELGAGETPENRLNAQRLDALFLRVFGVGPEEHQVTELIQFIDGLTKQLSEDGKEDPEKRVWTILCHALFASSRFQILE